MNTKKKTVEYGKYGYLFVLPFFIIFLIFQLYPLIQTFADSLVFSKKNGRNVVSTIGLGNFTEYCFGQAGGGELWHALAVTVVLWLLNFVPQIIFSLFLAAWFTDVKYKLRAAGAYKVIMYMPNIITAATIAVLFYSLFNTNGSLTLIFKGLGFIEKNVDILDAGWSSLLIIAFIQFWMWYGNTMIVMCAGILGINPALYEAAEVDGANSMQMFFQITLPLLKPIIQFTLVTSAIGGLQMYDIPYLFNAGGPIVKLSNGTSINSTTTVVMLIKKYVNNGPTQNYGRAAGYSVVLFVVTLTVSLLFYWLTSPKKEKPEKEAAATVEKKK